MVTFVKQIVETSMHLRKEIVGEKAVVHLFHKTFSSVTLHPETHH
jgi:hypothetical protein